MKFKPEDFSNCQCADYMVAERANQVLEEWLKDAPVVFSHDKSNWGAKSVWDGDTHKAKLICIEELKGE